MVFSPEGWTDPRVCAVNPGHVWKLGCESLYLNGNGTRKYSVPRVTCSIGLQTYGYFDRPVREGTFIPGGGPFGQSTP
jgi:hypothetical protein